MNCLEPHPQLPFLCTSGLDWDIKVWVPSCEKDPLMNGLSETIKTNCKARGNYTSGELSESQMLWILWRHLRSSNRIHVRFVYFIVSHAEYLKVNDFLENWC